MADMTPSKDDERARAERRMRPREENWLEATRLEKALYSVRYLFHS